MTEAKRCTWVTGLLDLGRGDPKQMGPDHTRSMAQYEKWLLALLDLEQPTIVYTDPAIWERLTPQLSDGAKKTAQFAETSLDRLTREFRYFEAVQQKRQDPQWVQKAPWLSDSPQARLSHYNPMVMSKVAWLTEAAGQADDPSQGFFWLDAGLIRTCPNLMQHHDWGNWLAEQTDRFVITSFPYIGGEEIHGFGREKMALLCQTHYVDTVVRGGFFGGQAQAVIALADRYQDMLDEAFALDDMGTEENILTALAHRSPETFFRHELKQDGLIWPLFEALGQRSVQGVVATKKPMPKASFTSFSTLKVHPPAASLEVYVLTFNSHEQLQLSIESWAEAFELANGVTIIDNSTDPEVVAANRTLAKRLGFGHVPQGNLGICGGRLWAAFAFQQTQSTHALFLEDDMLNAQRSGLCRSGFVQDLGQWLERALHAMGGLKLDLLKLNYTELFGSHRAQWAWCHLSTARRRALDPGHAVVHPPISDELLPATVIDRIEVVNGLPVAIGEPHYSNWPHLISQTGNRRLFIEPEWASPHEGAFMAKAFDLQRIGLLPSGVLLASPIEHRREHHYPAEARLECR